MSNPEEVIDISFAECEFISQDLIGANSSAGYEKTAKTILDGAFKALKLLQKNKVAKDLITKMMEALEKIFKDGDVVNGIITFFKKTFTVEEITNILSFKPEELKGKMKGLLSTKSGELDPESIGTGAELVVGAYLRVVKTGVSGILLALGPETAGISDGAMLLFRGIMNFVILVLPKIIKNIVPIIVKVINQLKKDLLGLISKKSSGEVKQVEVKQVEIKPMPSTVIPSNETPEQAATRVASELTQEGQEMLKKEVLPTNVPITNDEKSLFIQSIIGTNIKVISAEYLILDDTEDLKKIKQILKEVKKYLIKGAKGILYKEANKRIESNDFDTVIDAYLEFRGEDEFMKIYLNRMDRYESVKQRKLTQQAYNDLVGILDGAGFKFDELLGDFLIIKSGLSKTQEWIEAKQTLWH